MKEDDRLEIGDLVFACAYRGPASSAAAMVGVVVKLSPDIVRKKAFTMVTVFTSNGFEQVPKNSCQIISKLKKQKDN
tara:strand:+ start:857 stop:1087 length:231 start_codon:yes stop_codon:yes gene_type:complete